MSQKNIIALIERKSKEGIVIRYSGGATAEDIWYDEDFLFGKEVKKYMNYNKYVNELKSRLV